MRILDQDLMRIDNLLTADEHDFYKDQVILITGIAGSVGFELVNYLLKYSGAKKIIGIDNLILGYPVWLKRLVNAGIIDFYYRDISTVSLSEIRASEEASVIFHMASVASPVSYRENPLLTMDANVIGCRNLLDYYKDKKIKSFCYFSSSEIYGSPDIDHLPTDESYVGAVNCVGPRSCYDESKRFSETLCYVFARQYGMPCCILRPFNIFGPGMKVNDGRIPADCAAAILRDEDIKIFSDGTPTRTFCYISDAVVWILKAAAKGRYEIFNIGSDGPELSIKDFCELCIKVGKKKRNYTHSFSFCVSDDKEYLTDNPPRRCPDLSHSSESIGFSPTVSVTDGIDRFLAFFNDYGDRFLEEWSW